MSEWPTVTVEDLVAESILAKPMDGNHGSIHPKSSDYVTAGIPFVMASDLEGGQVNTKTCSFITEELANSLRKGFALEGDILISHKATIGRVAIVSGIKTPFIMLTPQVTYYRVLNSEKLDRRFLYYYFQSRPFLEVLGQWAGDGSTRAYLGITGQLKLPIVLPPIEVQREIAAILGALDDKIELNRKTAATLEEMARALYRSWFVDFDPVHANAEGRAPAHMDEATAALFPDRFGEDSLPEGWEEKTFPDLIEIVSGGTPKTSEQGYWGGEIPWYSVVDAPPDGQVFVVYTEKFITSEGLGACSAKLVQRGTTIISARGTVGKLAMAGQDMVFNQSCYGLRWKDGKADAFTYFSAVLAVEQLQSMAHGSVFSTITRKTFEGIDLVRCPVEVLEAFENTLRAHFDRLHGLLLENQTLAKLRDTLLPKLMSGEIRVGEARERVEEVA